MLTVIGTPGAANDSEDVTRTAVITFDNTWKYHDLGVDLGTSWRNASFNDASWTTGNAELGRVSEPSSDGPRKTDSI